MDRQGSKRLRPFTPTLDSGVAAVDVPSLAERGRRLGSVALRSLCPVEVKVFNMWFQGTKESGSEQ